MARAVIRCVVQQSVSTSFHSLKDPETCYCFTMLKS